MALVEAKLAAHVSYGAVGDLLGELLPVGRRIHRNEPCRHIAAIGGRLDAELASEEYSFITGPPAVSMRCPDMPLVVTIDGGYVHSSEQTSRRDGWFQAVCGTVTRHDGTVRRFGFVPNIDKHPRRRIHDTLEAQAMQPNQQVTFLSDGAPDLAGSTDRMNANAEYVLDWFHIAMRFTVVANTMKGLQPAPDPDDDQDDDRVEVAGAQPMIDIAEQLRSEIASAKWHVWHGNIHRAQQLLTGVSFGFDACAENDSRTKSGKMLDELRVYLDRNRATIPNYAERHLAGEPISSATAEATVNLVIAKRMVKKQQMRWSPTGAQHAPSPHPPTTQPTPPSSPIAASYSTHGRYQNPLTATRSLQPDLPRNVTVSHSTMTSKVTGYC